MFLATSGQALLWMPLCPSFSDSLSIWPLTPGCKEYFTSYLKIFACAGKSEPRSWKILPWYWEVAFQTVLSLPESGKCLFPWMWQQLFLSRFLAGPGKNKRIFNAPFSLFMTLLPLAHCVGTASGHEHNSVWPWLSVKLHVTHSFDIQCKTRNRKQGASLAGRRCDCFPWSFLILQSSLKRLCPSVGLPWPQETQWPELNIPL